MSKSATSLELRLLVISGIVMSGFSYLTNLLLANAMGPENFGQYTYALVLGALFGQVVVFGSTETGIRLQTTFGAEALDWILTAKIVNFLIVLIAGLCVFLINSERAILFALVVTLNSLSLATHYEAQGRNVRYACIFLVERILITLFIWFGIVFLDKYLMVWVFAILALSQIVSIFFQYIENQAMKISFRRHGLLNLYREGFFVLVFSLSKFAFGGVTRLLIFNQLGGERMGIFAAAWQFVPLSTLYFAQTTKTWRLRITEALRDRDFDEFAQNLKALAFFVMIPSLLAATMFSVFGNTIIEFLLTSEYHDAGPLMRYIGIYFLVVGFDSVVVLLAIANSKAKLAAKIYLISGAVTIFVCFFMGEDQGLERYLLTIIIGHFLAVVILGLFLLRLFRRQPK